MAQPLYFLPGAPAMIHSLDRWGLDYLTGTLSCRQCHSAMGPGTLVRVGGSDPHPPRYDPDGQTWHQMPERFAAQPVWFGWQADAPPTPDELAKPSQLEGPRLRLLDGNEWMVPRLRKYRQDDSLQIEFDSPLPRRLSYSSDGVLMAGDVVPQYQEIWNRALQVGETVLAGAAESGQGEMPFDQVLEFGLSVLALNYQASAWELATLGLVGEGEAAQLVRAALDLDGLEERLKNLQSRAA